MRACDACRRRKVKCDFETPECASCRIANLACGYEVPARKRGPRFRRTSSNNSGRVPVCPSLDTGSRSRSLTSPLSVLESVDEVSPPGLTERPPSRPNQSSHRLAQQDCERHQQYETRLERSTPRTEDTGSRILTIHEELVHALNRSGLQDSIEALALECIDLYIQYLFPIMPIVHEATLRASLDLFTSRSGVLFPTEPPVNSDYESIILAANLSLCRRYALLTAVCAETSFVCPATIFPKGLLIGDSFLKASRQTLGLIHDQDIEDPDSSSIIIRYFHSNSIHTTGKTRLAWHLLGEAIRIEMSMSLHLESSLEGLNSVEAQLRRNIFWQLDTGDKSSALLNDHHANLHDLGLKGQTTLEHASPSGYSLLVHSHSQTSSTYERQIMICFHLCQKLWTIASKLLQNCQRFDPFLLESERIIVPSGQQKSSLIEKYVAFTSFRDDLPTWLKHLSQDCPSDDAVTSYHHAGFWIQRINLHVTFHCLNLMILESFANLNLLEFLGFSSDSVMVALKKTEIAREMLSTIQEAPFEYLQINGESCVEKIRRIGASLLEIIMTSKNEQIVKRAQAELPELLEILARLDSRASDSIISQASR